jgi:signal transduction histidine kinase/DNA-binding NarL/FixJ family response regulator
VSSVFGASAEQLRLRGRHKASVSAYAGALEAAEASEFRLEAGVIALCARDAARTAGDSDQADRFAERAFAIWRAWGAVALLDQADPAPESEALEAARDLAISADRASRAKSRLLADVAHELRTPLQGMQGLLDLAGGDGRALDLPALSGVLASLKTVVDDLSEYGALSSGGAPVSVQAVSLEELVRSEVALAGSQPPRRCKGFDIVFERDVPARIDSDGARLRQVLRNLLSNAVKYGAGLVRVQVSRRPAPDGAHNILIAVEDEGEGIPEADLIRLFEPFERGEPGGGGEVGGLGLGLAVSRQVAQRLGGALTAHNRPSGGARFEFCFVAAEASAAVDEAAPLPPLRILVADDVALIRRVIAGLLRADGHQVVEAIDGDDAAASLERETFDLAIVDLTMPGRTGLEVLRAVQARPSGRARPVTVLLTASARDTVDAEAAEAGAALVLRKPVSAPDLRRALQNLFADRLPSSRTTTPVLPPDTEAEVRAELRSQVALLLAPNGKGRTPEAAHRTAGLAAQFGWPELADACERLEADLLAGAAPQAALDQLATALAAAFEIA